MDGIFLGGGGVIEKKNRANGILRRVSPGFGFVFDDFRGLLEPQFAFQCPHGFLHRVREVAHLLLHFEPLLDTIQPPALLVALALRCRRFTFAPLLLILTLDCPRALVGLARPPLGLSGLAVGLVASLAIQGMRHVVATLIDRRTALLTQLVPLIMQPLAARMRAGAVLVPVGGSGIGLETVIVGFGDAARLLVIVLPQRRACLMGGGREWL